MSNVYTFQPGPKEWPNDPFFYMVARDGLYKCRNHRFYKSCVQHEKFTDPLPLPELDEYCYLNYPLVSAQIMRDTIAFFDVIAQRHKSEAIVLLAYDANTEQIVPVVPKQTSGGMHVDYDINLELPDHLLLTGDIHSHVDAGAFHSGVDIHDEEHRPGIHITLGKVRQEPVEISAEVVVDKSRFKINNLSLIMEPFHGRSDRVPDGWMEQFTYKPFVVHHHHNKRYRKHKQWVPKWLYGGHGYE